MKDKADSLEESIIEFEDNTNENFFDPSRIDVGTTVQSVYTLLQRMKHNEMQAPTFQRNDGIWTIENKSRLIESILVRIPLPLFYIDATDEDNWKIVDGLQRLTALNEYCNLEAFSLKGLEYLKHLEGKKFSQLDRGFQRRIEETDVSVVLIKPNTPENVKFNIFKRINTGGLPLSPQEIRHALNQGFASKLLPKLARNEIFLEVWEGRTDNKRMWLEELILRGLAYLFMSIDEVIKFDDIDSFLNHAMDLINKEAKRDEETVIKKIDKFLHYLQFVKGITGENTFRKISIYSNRKLPPNVNVYETWLSIINDVDISKFESNSAKEALYRKYVDLFELKSFNYYLSSRKPETIIARYRTLLSIFDGNKYD